MPRPSKLPFDPLERAGEIWEERIGDASSMRLATSIMRVHQLVGGRLDAALRPHRITFARYEVLRLLSFSKEGRLPLSKIGERLMVHATSVTNAIDRLEDQGFVVREPDPDDRRRTFAELTTEGARVLEAATQDILAIDFGVGELDVADQKAAYEVLRGLRAGDFD